MAWLATTTPGKAQEFEGPYPFGTALFKKSQQENRDLNKDGSQTSGGLPMLCMNMIPSDHADAYKVFSNTDCIETFQNIIEGRRQDWLQTLRSGTCRQNYVCFRNF